jgi:hypothetical protein
MPEGIINSSNVERAAEYLLILDAIAVEDIHKSSAYDWLQTLRRILERYYYRQQKHYLALFAKEVRAEIIQQNVDTLIQCVRAFIQILIPSVKEQLIAFLTDINAALPTVGSFPYPDDEIP